MVVRCFVRGSTRARLHSFGCSVARGNPITGDLDDRCERCVALHRDELGRPACPALGAIATVRHCFALSEVVRYIVGPGYFADNDASGHAGDVYPCAAGGGDFGVHL